MSSSREENAPSLTHSQKQIWIGQRLNPESPLYNMAFAWVFEPGLRAELFQRAWKRVADASDALRTRVVERDGAALLQPARRGASSTELLDLGGGPEPKARFLEWCRERCATPLALDASLVDSVLVDLGDGRWGWYLNLHHLITDAWSTVLLYRQVAAEYAALLGEGERPTPLAGYYPTAAALESGTSAPPGASEHWASRLERADRSLPLYGHPAAPDGTASTRLTLRLDEERTRAFERLAGEPGFLSLSPEMSRFALFSTLLLSWLERLSGRRELGFDAPISGRPTPESKRALGLFIEMFPFTTTPEEGETFRSLGARCLHETELFLRYGLPGTSAPSGASASNVVLNYFPLAFGDFAGLPAEVEWIHPGHGDSVHALRVQVHDFSASGGITLHFDFNDRALPAELAERSLEHFERLLAALLDDPDAEIARVELLTVAERSVLEQLNEAGDHPLPDRTVVAMFLAQAERSPDAVAVREGSRALSFAELERGSAALAATLGRRGVAPGERVAILARRSVEAVVAILGVLRAGAAYVPLDPAYPRERLEALMSDAGCRVLLTAPASGPAAALGTHETVALDVSEAIDEGTDLPLTADAPELEDLCYVLYTSGSTGKPKGVLVEHHGLADYLEWAARTYVRGERLRFPLFTSLAFDLTVTSLFLPLITGGELLVYPESEGPVDASWMDVARDDEVDFLKLTPSHLSLLEQMPAGASRVRRLVVGGEALPTRLAAEIQDRLGPDAELYNEYGPTEAIVGCVAHRYDPDEDRGASVPIGVPADHVRVEVLNEAATPVPLGVPGELWVGRPGLARGYLGLDELTRERFVPSPEGRRYRTGDRVRVTRAGALEYLGRLDRQLKISGFRVEPAEIEAALLDLPEVAACTVVARQRPGPASLEPNELGHCRRCGLSSSHPRALLDGQGLCAVCRDYDAIRDRAHGYFRTMHDLAALFAESAHNNRSEYDCLMLYSGGKDSTYALCRLVEMGLSVYAFTLDNGFISEGAKENIRRVTAELGVPLEMATTPAMNAIFRDSLLRFANVCQGCFKTIYTLATLQARELGIPVIVTGLSRGQMFETRLTEEMFRDGRHSADEIDAAVLAARKVYHRTEDEVSRSLGVEIFRDDRLFEEIRYVDFYRYCDVELSELFAYLRQKVPWVRPEDTGRSTNCLINDVGIYVHQREHGFHNYALPYSWDVRMGHKTRDEARRELEDEIDLAHVSRTLAEIGLDAEQWTAAGRRPALAAYYVASSEISEGEIRHRLARRLPTQLIPTYLQQVESIPLTVQGKVDVDRLPQIELDRRTTGATYRAPEGPVAEFLARLWSQRLGVARVGADDGFFELGGTSLQAMEVMLELCREYDVELPLATLFLYPTLTALARITEDRILEDVSALSETERRQLLEGDAPPA